MNQFGMRLKEIRTDRGITQTELAKKLDVSNGLISFWENDLNEPTVFNLRKISIILGCSADYLLGLSDNPEIK